jgi:hypothetical protein
MTFPGFPMVFPWFSHGFPMVFPWFSHGFPMVFGDPKQAAFQTLGFARRLEGVHSVAVGLAGDVWTYQYKIYIYIMRYICLVIYI